MIRSPITRHSFFIPGTMPTWCIRRILISNSIFMLSKVNYNKFAHSFLISQFIRDEEHSLLSLLHSRGLIIPNLINNHDQFKFSSNREIPRVASAKLRWRQKSEELDTSTDSSRVQMNSVSTCPMYAGKMSFPLISERHIRAAKFNGIAWRGKFMRGKCVGDKSLSRAKLRALCS
jgi:hypothetical protein